MHLIADAADVEDHVILAVGIDQALQLADHAPDHLEPQRRTAAMMRMRDGDRQRVGGVGRFRLGLGQQDFQHHQDLVLVGVAGADHGLLDLVGRIFRDRDPEHRRRQHRDPARLAELQGGDAVLVDKSLFDRGFRRLEIAEHGGEALMDRQQAARQRQAVRRLHRAAADEGQPVAVDLDHAPAGAAQARIDAEDTDGVANWRRCHGVVIPPEAARTKHKRAVIPAKAGIQYAGKSAIELRLHRSTGSPGRAGRDGRSGTTEG